MRAPVGVGARPVEPAARSGEVVPAQPPQGRVAECGAGVAEGRDPVAAFFPHHIDGEVAGVPLEGKERTTR